MDGDENALAALRLAIDDYKEERAALLSTLGITVEKYVFRFVFKIIYKFMTVRHGKLCCGERRQPCRRIFLLI